MNNLIQQWKEAKEAENAAIKARKSIEQEIIATHDNVIKSQLDKDYGTGTATLEADGEVLTLTYSKRVSWDQKQLWDLYQGIASNGDDPEEYIDAKYSIAESKYKAWPEHIRNSFESAREVKPSSPTFKIKESK